MSGIKLNISESGDVSVDETEPLQECLGGVMCPRCERSEEGAPLTIRCNAVKPEQDPYVFGFDKCPLNKWARYLDVRSPDHNERLRHNTNACFTCFGRQLWRLKDNPKLKIKNAKWQCMMCHPPVPECGVELEYMEINDVDI